MNKLYIYKDTWIYIGQSVQKKIHEHHAIQLFIAPKASLKIEINGEEELCTIGIIDSDIPHCCTTQGIEIIFISIDPESEIGQRLKQKFLSGNCYKIFQKGKQDSVLTQCKHPDFVYNPYKLLQSLAGNAEINKYDERIRRTIQYMSDNLTEPINTELLADISCLSESRFFHLFKEQLGISARKYLQWLRLRKACELISGGYTITNAAYSTGFSNASHFNRICNRMFGLSPSVFIENSSFVQVESFYEL